MRRAETPLKGLPLAAINDGSEEGRRLLATARRILANLSKPDARVMNTTKTADLSFPLEGEG